MFIQKGGGVRHPQYFPDYDFVVGVGGGGGVCGNLGPKVGGEKRNIFEREWGVRVFGGAGPGD